MPHTEYDRSFAKSLHIDLEEQNETSEQRENRILRAAVDKLNQLKGEAENALTIAQQENADLHVALVLAESKAEGSASDASVNLFMMRVFMLLTALLAVLGLKRC